jgi:adenylate cyclase
MTNEPDLPSGEGAEFWRKVLVEGEKPVRIMRGISRKIPSSPRCKICFAPFASIGGRLYAFIGMAPSRKNPLFCNS